MVERILNEKLFGCASPNAFTEDPLRMLRAFRFSSQLGFGICPETVLGIQKSATLIQNVSGERVRDELEIVFRSNRSAKIIEQMAESSLLWEILPELKHSRGFEPKCVSSFRRLGTHCGGPGESRIHH